MLMKWRLLTERAHFSSKHTRTPLVTSVFTIGSLSVSKIKGCAFKETITQLARAPLSCCLKSVTNLKVAISRANLIQTSRSGYNESLYWSCTTSDASASKPLINQRLCQSHALNGSQLTLRFGRRSFSKHLWRSWIFKIAVGSGQIGHKKILKTSLSSMRWRKDHMSSKITFTFKSQ